MKEITVRIAQKGYCAGPVFLLRPTDELSFSACEDVEEEKRKLGEAIEKLSAELKEQAASAVPETAKILEADRMILCDEEFSAAIEKVLEEKKAALDYAVQEGCRELTALYENSGSEYIRERAADVRGLGQKLTDIALNRKTAALTKPSVVAAEEMTPEAFAALDARNVLGLITRKGAVTSHVSIMAGNLGIPYVYAAEPFSEISAEVFVIVDTEAGTVLLNPGEEVRNDAEQKMRKLREEAEQAEQEAENAPLRTKICVNISDAKNTEELKTCGADGVGLFRSEFLFLESAQAPTEEEQYQAYRAVLDAMGEKEVIIRTMDIGSDKKASWLKMPDEKNPALGNRGVRLSFANPELFRTQLRALLRAGAHGNLKIMFPMIASEWEVEKIRGEVQKTAEELEKEGIPCRLPPLGIMIETPAAALIADRLAKKVDFFSIGTNDLTQYTIALDREAEGLEEFYQPHHEAILRLIRMVAEAGHRAGIPTDICGELGSDPEMIPALIEAGVDELSVSAAKLGRVRRLAAKAEKELYLELGSPCDGTLIPMQEIGDPVFASGMLGEAIGVYPTGDTVYAPVSGKLVELADTGHAFTVEKADGKQVLVHVGIDTVRLGGKGFKALAKEGDALVCGQPVLKIDLQGIRESGYDPTVVVIALE